VERDDLALNDELEALLTQAAASPQFRSGVLQRVDALDSARAGRWFTLAAAMAMVALVIVTTSWWMRLPAGVETRRAERAAAALTKPEMSAPARAEPPPQTPVPVSSPRASSPSAEVLIAADEVEAFRAFVSIAKEGRLSADMFQPLADLPAVIEPLRVEPLALIPPLKEPEL
jgi:hypothetical protein